jgi:EmrB/QacA subfamily drug resistance transporter
VTGGWLLEHFSWGSVFLVNLPVLVLAIVGCVFVVPPSRDAHAPKLDLGGACLSMAGLTALLWAIIEAPEQGWTAPRTLTAFVIAAAVLGAFVLWESRQAHPMLNLNFFRNPRFSAASAAVTLTFFALFGSLFLVTQYMQSVMGYTALQSGVRYLPLAAALLVTSPMSAKLAARFGSKLVVTTGLFTVALGLLLMIRLEAGTGYTPLLISMLVLATGMGLTMAPATESIMGSLPAAQAGVGSAVNDTTREVGGALGVAILGSVLSSVFGSRMVDVLAGSQLPPEARHVAEHSVTGAVTVADEIGGPSGEALANAAKTAFVDGLHTTSLVAAGFAALGALIALVFLPARAPGGAEDAVDASVTPLEPRVVTDDDNNDEDDDDDDDDLTDDPRLLELV